MSIFSRGTPPLPAPGTPPEPQRPSFWAWAHMAEDERLDYEVRQAAWLRDTSDPCWWSQLCDLRSLFVVYYEEDGDLDPTIPRRRSGE